MSTHDVPGANPDNQDELHAGCWAEHIDGSLIFVAGNEGGNVIYQIFDVINDTEYRDSMEVKEFQDTFTWDSNNMTKAQAKKQNEKWTWHDKTPFPWDRVGVKFKTGSHKPSAASTLTAAQRVAESLQLRARQLDRDVSHRQDQETPANPMAALWDRIKGVIDEAVRK